MVASVCASSRRARSPPTSCCRSSPYAQLDALLALGVPVLTFSWGQPGRERIARCHELGTRVVVQVGSAAGARQAVADGADVLIAQGIEAGGHVQSTTPLRGAHRPDRGRRGHDAGARCGRADGPSGHRPRARVRGFRRDARHALRGDRRERCAPGVQGRARGCGAITRPQSRSASTGTGRTRRTAFSATRRSSVGRTRAALLRAGVPMRTRRRLVGRGPRSPRYEDAPPLAGDTGAVGEMCLYAGAGCAAHRRRAVGRAAGRAADRETLQRAGAPRARLPREPSA